MRCPNGPNKNIIIAKLCNFRCHYIARDINHWKKSPAEGELLHSLTKIYTADYEANDMKMYTTFLITIQNKN